MHVRIYVFVQIPMYPMRVIEQNRFAKKKARLFVAIEREIQSVMKRKRTASHHYVLLVSVLSLQIVSGD